MMFKTNALMSVTAIISSLLGFVFMAIILLKSQKYFVKRQEGLGKLNSHIEEIYSGLNVVKVYNGQDDANQKFDKINNEVSECSRKSGFLSGLMHPMMGFVGNFGYVAVCIVGALLTMNGKISFGVIIAFITYVRLFTMPLSSIAQEFTFIQSALASSERVFEFLDEKEMSKEENKDKLLKNDVKGNIEFKNVSFKYTKKENLTLDNLSLNIKTNQKTAIVGRSGNGKTTIFNLLLRYFDVTNGEVLIDGVDIKDLTEESLRKTISCVRQNPFLFNMSIFENFKIVKPDITLKEVKEVCKRAYIDEYIESLPKKYNTIIGEGGINLSGGQKQRLAIARTLLLNTKIILFDEATSALDNESQKYIKMTIDDLTKDHTIIIIAHRLSTIIDADEILVIENGKLELKGNHKDLLKKSKVYKGLYENEERM